MRIVVGCVFLLLLLFPPEGTAQKRVFLSEEGALGKVLHGADSVRERTVSLGREEAEALADEFNMTILDTVYTFYEAVEDGGVVGRAVIMNVLGQNQPITFIVGILPDGTVEHVEIMVYRETRGSQVRRRAFLEQFEEKSVDDPIRVNNDIMNITGATMSSRAVADGVRLALRLHERLMSSDKTGRERR